MICGLTRVHNEELIIEDTIRHYLKFCERIVAYDDGSTDKTVQILRSFDEVEIILGYQNEPQNESVHRQKALDRINVLGAEWALCFDADERLVFPGQNSLPFLINNTVADKKIDGFRMKLFDGYMTNEKQAPYINGQLLALDRLWGPERRDIMFMFRPTKFSYQGQLQREPRGAGIIIDAPIYCAHYGKCLSVEHWEETCDYYSTWPGDYGPKWRARKGKAIHTKSDWGGPLYTFEELMYDSSKQEILRY